MSNMNKRQRDYFLPLIIERNGHDLCIRCGNPGDIIHHVNGDDTDQRLENLDLLCKSCNKLKKLQKKNLPITTKSYQISAAHKKNLLAEPSFRRWLLGVCLSNNGHYPEDLVIKQGSFDCNISTETTKRYLEKLCDHPSSLYLTILTKYGQEIYMRENAPKEIDEI